MGENKEMQESMKCCREKYWEELSDTEKIERMHKIVKALIKNTEELENTIHKLKNHSHNNKGDIMISIHQKDKEQSYIYGKDYDNTEKITIKYFKINE